MARLVECEAWADPNSLAMHLHYDLSDEYLVVDAPTVRGCELDVVVVGPQGLFVLHEDGAADGKSVDGGSENAETEPAADAGERRDDIEERITSATKALEAFLRDEFPNLSPTIHHLRVLTTSESDGSSSGELPKATLGTAAVEISSTEADEKGTLPSLEGRADLAVALRDRKLTVSQKASQPFVFRSGRALGSGTEVWSIREAVRHMKENPESGIYHLRNGTLAAWFHEEGAEHLARLASDVMREDPDYRMALETFLIGTGLVSRPKLEVRPEVVNLGYALAGESVARRIRLGRGRGRGYPFGRLEPGVPWLSAHPREFDGEEPWSVVTVRAETEALPITQEPRKETIYIHSNASEEPMEVPVRLHIVGLPSFLNQHLLRPTVGLVTAGLIGSGIGWLLISQGVPAAELLGGLEWLPLAPRAVWVALIALAWAGMGLVRGATQPQAWPTGYAVSRWLARIAVWIGSLGLVGTAARWAWAGMRDTAAPPIPRIPAWALMVGPTALAIVPATIGEIRSSRSRQETSARAIRWSFLRPLLLPAGGLGLAVALRLSGPQLRQLWEQVDLSALFSAIGTWIGEGMEALESLIGRIVDELYLRYYGR